MYEQATKEPWVVVYDAILTPNGFTTRTRAAPGLSAKRFMALEKMSEFRARGFAIMLVVMAGSVTCGPASAQYWGDRR